MPSSVRRSQIGGLLEARTTSCHRFPELALPVDPEQDGEVKQQRDGSGVMVTKLPSFELS
jgi:hypothetical protein